LTDIPYRLCAIDLDDTLLDASHALTERSLAAVQKVRSMGATVVIASGRMHAATLHYAQQLALDTPIISYNGAMVRYAGTGETLLEEHVEAGLAAEIRDYARQNSLQLNYYLHDMLYSEAYTSWLKLYHDRTDAPIEILPDFEAKLQNTTPTKLVIVDSPEKVNALLPLMQERYGKQSYVTRSNAEYLEFMPPNADKGKALALVAAKYNISAAQTLAFGDSWNDIPMLQWAGLGIAVANAKPEVRQAADRTVQSNIEDGVARALADIFKFQA
jgi:Cof subfamily protein (haloacid dehalogenase superfamily)